MREILFRGKDVDGKWVEGCCIVDEMDTNKVYIGYIFGSDGRQPHDTDVSLVDPKAVCQYTGLTDKNGRKIFEGDIVRAIYKPKDKDLAIDDFIIKWDKYYCKFVGYYVGKENVYTPLLFGSQTSFEVIGNSFDNPGLLKE